MDGRDSSQVRLAQPSKFWEKLAAVHAEQLDRAGMERMKRHQALRYFTWRCAWVPSSDQMGFLLRHTKPADWLRAAAERVELSDGPWHDMPWRLSERWLYTVMIRLLWQYTQRHDRIGAVALPEPTLGDPLPVSFNGRLISQDLANSALEVNAMARALSGRRPHSIVEVGAGYGRSAYVLLNIFPECRYTIIDIEPALSISRWYLTNLFQPDRLRFLSPDEAMTLPSSSFDLALSISSLHEMRPDQLAGYISLIDRLTSPGIVYIKQWRSWHNPEDNVTLRFADYPIPRRWALIFRGRAPVQTNFQEAAWAVPDRQP